LARRGGRRRGPEAISAFIRFWERGKKKKSCPTSASKTGRRKGRRKEKVPPSTRFHRGEGKGERLVYKLEREIHEFVKGEPINKPTTDFLTRDKEKRESHVSNVEVPASPEKKERKGGGGGGTEKVPCREKVQNPAGRNAGRRKTRKPRRKRPCCLFLEKKRESDMAACQAIMT